MIPNRRAFLRLAGLTALLGLLPWAGRSGIRRADASMSLGFSTWRNLWSARELGRQVLRLYPYECHRRKLAALIDRRIRAFDPDVAPATTLHILDGGERLDRAISAAVRGDFDDGRIRVVNGWLLAETECRVCALAALDQWDDR